MRRREIPELACLLPLSHPMKPGRKLRRSADEARASVRVEVLGEDTISSQARVYADTECSLRSRKLQRFRRFDALVSCFVQSMERAAAIALSCTVTVALDGADPLRVRTIGAHAYAAINRAVERITTMRAPRV